MDMVDHKIYINIDRIKTNNNIKSAASLTDAW